MPKVTLSGSPFLPGAVEDRAVLQLALVMHQGDLARLELVSGAPLRVSYLTPFLVVFVSPLAVGAAGV